MKRLLRLIIFAIVILGVIFIVLNFGLAWILVTAMTHPICQSPHTIEGVTPPEEHWLTTEDEISIRIWYYPSQNGAAVITFGGMSGSLGNRLPPAAPLIQAGYGVVQMDSRSCAQPSASVTQGYDELYDGKAAYEFLLSRPEVDPERIGVMGFSMGGATALRVAAHQPEIGAVVRDGGFSNLGILLSPQDTQTLPARVLQATIYIFYKYRSGFDPWEVDPVADLRQIDPRPVLLIYGEHEAEEGWKQTESASNNVELWVVPDGSHGRNHQAAPEEYAQRVLDWFDRALLK